MELITKIIETIVEILKVKNIVTLILTIALVMLLIGKFQPSNEFTTVFCTAYGSIITHFFSEK